MNGLPPQLEALVAQVVMRSGLDGIASAEVRADLEQHLRDGLARGRSIEELVRKFGDPVVTGSLISRGRSPRATTSSGRGDGLFASVATDVRHAARALWRSPSLTVTATIVLALGVGANTVVFTVLNELLLKPLPVEDQAGLVDIWADIPGGNSFLGVAYQDFLTFRAENNVLEGLAAFSGRQLEFGPEGAVEEVVGQFVSPDYFPLLGLTPSVGSMSFDRKSRFGGPPVVVLSHAFWTESFGADPAIVGRTVRLEGHVATVIGVGPQGFAGHFIGFSIDLWLPLTALDPLVSGYDPADRSRKDLELIGRLRPGITAAAARSALNTLAEGIERQYPEINRGHRVGLTPTTGLDHSLQAGVRGFVLVLTTVSLLVLIIACLNVGSILLVRTMSRDKELCIRIALGSGRPRLLRELLTEAAVLVGLGTVLGVGVAVRTNAALVDTLQAVTPGIGLELAADWRVLTLTALAAAVACVLAAVAPVLHVFRRDPARALRAGSGAARESSRLRSGLVMGQVAVSVVLVIATGLFVRALVAAGRFDPGFAADEVATFALTLPAEMGSASQRGLQREVVDGVRVIPGVRGVTIAAGPPIGVARSPMFVDVPGVQPPSDVDRHVVDARVVGPGYLNVLGIRLLAGRDVTEADDRDAPVVAVVSEAFVERFWPGADPLGRAFTAGNDEVRVVGVASDARFIIQDDTPDAIVYLSRAGQAGAQTFVTLRADEPLQLTSAIDALVARNVPGHRRIEANTGRQALDVALLPQRLGSIIVGGMGLAALLLAAVGLYGLVQFTVTRDTHELGVRLALGGGRNDLIAVVLRKGFRLVAVGTSVGVGAALLLAPGLGGFLSGVSPRDPVTYLAVIGCFATVALVASWLPARRALRIEATEALRGD